MANSPQIEVFFLYDFSGSPLIGASPTFSTYKDETGTNLSTPTITEIGGGAYKFTPVLNPGHGIVYVIDAGLSSNPRRLARFIRPEDYYPDLLQDIHDEHFGKWAIITSGPDANRLILYKADGITVLQKFNLFDAFGSPTSTDAFSRVPTP